MKLQRQVRDASRVFEVDLAVALHQRRTLIVAIRDADFQWCIPVTIRQRAVDTQLPVHRWKPVGVDGTEHPDQRLLARQPIGYDLITDEQR